MVILLLHVHIYIYIYIPGNIVGSLSCHLCIDCIEIHFNERYIICGTERRQEIELLEIKKKAVSEMLDKMEKEKKIPNYDTFDLLFKYRGWQELIDCLRNAY